MTGALNRREKYLLYNAALAAYKAVKQDITDPSKAKKKIGEVVGKLSKRPE